MPINRMLKDKRAPEEIELLNKAFNHALNLLGWLIVMTRFAIWSPARLSRSGRQVLASREKSRKWPWPGLAYGKAASVGGHFIPNFTCWRVRDMPPNREIVRLSRSEVIVRRSE